MSYHEYIIVGAGPAGLQMGYFMEQAGRNYLILEANAGSGSFFSAFPRHRTMISINKRFNFFKEPEFNLRHDWNSLLTHDSSHLFTNYSADLYPKADDMVRYLEDFAEKFALNIQYNTRITAIAREADGDKHFVLTDEQGNEYRCARLLMATGPVKPNLPEEIEGIELAEGYETHDIDPTRYENKRVIIIGSGNSAFEVANHLAGHAAVVFISIGNRLIKHAWQTHFVGDLRSFNNTILDMFQLKLLHTVEGSNIRKIERQADGLLRVYYEDEFPHWNHPGVTTGWSVVEHVIRCTGWKYVDKKLFAPDITPAADQRSKYPVLSPVWESSVPDLFFIGTSMAARDRKAASGFIHGFRYNVRTLFHFLEERYHNVPLPTDTFALNTLTDLRQLVDHLIHRISTTSALYQLFGTMCDVLVLSPNQAELFYELPVQYVLEQPEFTHNKKIIIFTLEFGFHNFPAGTDANSFVRRNDPERPGCVAFIHPVFRYYENGVFVKGRLARHTGTVRYDQIGDEFTGDVAYHIPTNILLNFINEWTQLTTEIFPEANYQYEEDSGGFSPLPAERRLENPGLPQCLLTVDEPQVVAIEKLLGLPQRAPVHNGYHNGQQAPVRETIR